ncbi:MAG TPA: bifunctional UDP-3-O-[3-hydroxymyristoyl] N-acetylglucosamine deacetylase/3-hydroxyacyl-ACP dehydratase [bacterium]|nr:bifunctional UDP-3-O-[3-hydroxymyristoyl] N-acetylglucosamine deacetylase/3-hydroxyacyl-ACP dehydratase [bacterium]HNT65838.1 bifunctional UDP-3-O-[3-hydroxymyristoyl] N-acetylglucosamine deacetylase/3-hydroxyacyl-ACP dehydratase [bacterium]HOX85656.1 bifunctional UDP-3-O-[3-hydroxymyristoyl] N-acetylglucosamine deacetylase/3-hydroxyacyl-ACP dehydratase [bacterium]HPG44815.1 bifunctional UDP-3-O-[3-hydroxymyristoyl] N-acetylglucosamine deacetylase/3-hydroxyacyl-ACP dehydratase [bacterium]HPM
MLKNQQTIKESASYAGVGLHTGNKTSITFKPAPVNNGIVFKRIDVPDSKPIPADVDHVLDISRGTTIGIGDLKVHTVEHVLAAISGLEIDNIICEVDGNEPPVGDGSSLPFVEVLLKAGFMEQDSPRDYLVIDRTIAYSEPERGIDIVVFPSDEFRITFMVDYKNPALGTQYTSMYSLPEEFVTEFAAARTFCFLHEVEELRKSGLIQGGALDNAVVIIDREMSDTELRDLRKLFGIDNQVTLSKNGILNGKELRYPNEPVRHKALDLIGDLALLGMPLKGHVMAARSGHAANAELVKLIRKEFKKRLIQSKYQVRKGNNVFLDSEAINKILPHRYPFLLVDQVLDLVPLEYVVGIKNISNNEPFFQGHFPGKPIMPGVLIVEAMAQVGGIMLLNSETDPTTKLVVFTGIDNVRFRKMVVPGDQLRCEVEMGSFRRSMCKMYGRAFVGDDLVCEAEMMAAIVDNDNKGLTL